MKYILFAFFLPLISYGQEQLPCNTIRNGRFMIFDEDGNEFFIERKDSIQTETVPAYRIDGKFKIDWISDCRYTIAPIWMKEDGEERKDVYNKICTVEIIEVTKEYYITETTRNDSELKLRDKVFIKR